MRHDWHEVIDRLVRSPERTLCFRMGSPGSAQVTRVRLVRRHPGLVARTRGAWLELAWGGDPAEGAHAPTHGAAPVGSERAFPVRRNWCSTVAAFRSSGRCVWRVEMGSPGSAQVTAVRLRHRWPDIGVRSEGRCVVLSRRSEARREARLEARREARRSEHEPAGAIGPVEPRVLAAR